MCFYIISSGKVEINQTTQTGKIKSIATLKSGEFLGEGALSQDETNHVRPANALVIEDAHLMILPRDKFYDLLKRDPETALDFIFQVLETTYKRLKFANEELIVLYEV